MLKKQIRENGTSIARYSRREWNGALAAGAPIVLANYVDASLMREAA